MKYKLTAEERLTLLATLPEKGSYEAMKLVDEVINTVRFTDEESKALGMYYTRELGFRVVENPEHEYEIGKAASKLIADQLRSLDSKRKLDVKQVKLFDKFITK